MSNHYHVVLHINKKQAKSWETKEILYRWTQLFAGPYLVQRYLAGDVLGKAELLHVEEYAAEYRSRLMDISWFMRCLNEHLEAVHNLLNKSTKKAKLVNCKLVFSLRSVFFHKRRQPSNQENERSTTQRCGITAKV